MRAWRVPYPKFGAGPGLERVGAIAAALGVGLEKFGARGAAVVGSNGKGSTAAMSAALLCQAGASVGLFTSPHLFALNERFRIDDEDIADQELQHHWTRVRAAIAATDLERQVGGFEFLFLIAADWFAARGCAFTIWEAGIGGRLDPVRLIAAPRLALTSLDFEHTELLGQSLEEIAREKLDAAPPGARAYIGASCAHLRGAVEAHCAARGVSAIFPEPLSLQVDVALAGAHQRENAALAAALAGDALGETLSMDTVVRGLAQTRWPGRLEILGRDPLVVIDVGHTPAAVRAAQQAFQALRGARAGVLVCGVSNDKSVAAIVESLAVGFEQIICASAGHKGAPVDQIAAHARAANPDAEITLAESVAEARQLALHKASTRAAAIYVAGGLFLAAEFRAVHLGREPGELRFF